MKKIYTILLAVLFVGSAFAQTFNQNVKTIKTTATVKTGTHAVPSNGNTKSTLATVPYLETFDAGMPADYQVFDLDGFTPNTDYTFMTAGWVATQLTGMTTPAAVSTSWYTSAHTSNDWMITTGIQIPATGTYQIAWKGQASDVSPYNDGYEVYVTKTIAGATPVTADFSAAAVFTTAGETNGAWEDHSYTIPATMNGSTIYIAFRNNSTDRNLLFIDDIEVKEFSNVINDMKVISTYASFSGLSYYAVTPISQQGPIDFNCVAKNNGSAQQTNVTLHVNANNGALTGTSTPQAFAAGLQDTLTATLTPAVTVPTNFGVKLNITQTETDENLLNNVCDSVYFAIDKTWYNRAASLSNVLSSYSFVASGVPAATGMEFGANYHFSAADQIDSISVLIYDAIGTGTLMGKVYSNDLTTGAKTLVAQTLTYTPTGSGYVTLKLATPYTVAAGSILTATVVLDCNIAAHDTIYIGADAEFPGATNVASAIYMTVGGIPNWYSTNSVPFVGLVMHDNTSNIETATENNINVYPNPANDVLNITNAENATITIYNVLGEVVKTVTNVNQISLANVAEGSYIVRIVKENNVITKKINVVK